MKYIFILIMIMACTRTKDVVTTDVERAYAHFGFKQVATDGPTLAKVLTETRLKPHNFNISQVIHLQSLDDDIYMIKISENNYYAVRGRNASSQMTEMVYNRVGNRIELFNGEVTVNTFIKNESTGFCQRLSSQTYGECFNQEVKEFCNSLVSCVAVSTQPTVVLLIGISCTCMSSQITSPYSPPPPEPTFKPYTYQ
jgi:hypothetical protein